MKKEEEPSSGKLKAYPSVLKKPSAEILKAENALTKAGFKTAILFTTIRNVADGIRFESAVTDLGSGYEIVGPFKRNNITDPPYDKPIYYKAYLNPIMVNDWYLLGSNAYHAEKLRPYMSNDKNLIERWVDLFREGEIKEARDHISNHSY
jgi:hypothetical protein